MIIYKRKTTVIVLVLVSILLLYLACYFNSTTVFHGELSGDKIDCRVFHSKFHYSVFWPIIKLEELSRMDEPSSYFFYGHIKNGASLPPAREDV